MRRKDAVHGGRGRSLISTRTSQQQQRRAQNTNSRNQLPRSYSSPAPQNDAEATSSYDTQNKNYIRSFSSPDPKRTDHRKNLDLYYRPKSTDSRSDIDSDLESFEQLEEALIDIDADQDQTILGIYRRPEGPKRVITSLLPGSGLQKVCLRPVSSGTTQTLQSARDVLLQKDKVVNKGSNRLNFQPLVVQMPSRLMVHTEPDHFSLGVEELQSSPPLEIEAAELEREIDNAEQHMEGGVAIAAEESDDEMNGKSAKTN